MQYVLYTLRRPDLVPELEKMSFLKKKKKVAAYCCRIDGKQGSRQASGPGYTSIAYSL